MKYLFLFFLSISFGLFAQEYPQDFFSKPVNHNLVLSGTFGELRPGHFHAGLDIKSKDGKQGEPILASGDGYIYRINISSDGYGNALYIMHPNGYISVYAHMQKFIKQIGDYTRAKQYEKKQFEVDLYPPKDAIQVKKGQIIGKMGSSGRSFGPHLHFEIRESLTEKPINPMLFGIGAKDNIKPMINELKIFGLNDKTESINEQKFTIIKTGSNYKLKNDTITYGAWRVGLGIKTYDKLNNARNWNGVYSVDMYIDEELSFNYTMDKIGFDETKYINAHLDFKDFILQKSYFNRCYKLPGNKLEIYNSVKENGIIKLYEKNPRHIEFVVTDYKGNKSNLSFWIKRGKITPPTDKIFNYELPFDEASKIDNNDLILEFEKGSLFQNCYLFYQMDVEINSNIYSPYYQIGDKTIPLFKPFTIKIKPTKSLGKNKEHAFIANCYKNDSSFNQSWWEGDFLVSKIDEFGSFTIEIDTITPIIKPIRFGKNMSKNKSMKFKITDNYQIGKIEAYVDGTWILMEYDAKNNTIIHYFDKHISKGKHSLKLLVSDLANNTKEFVGEFTR